MAVTYTIAPNVARQLLDNDANPLSGGLFYIYNAGTLVEATVYQTNAGTAWTQPIQLDGSGRIPGSQELFLVPGNIYDYVVKNSAGVTLWTKPGIGAIPVSSVNVDIVGLAGEDLAAGDAAYLSNGSGPLTAGSWYKADADQVYSSTTPVMAFVVSAITAGASGTLRMDGQIALAGPLTPGTLYYISATSGVLTTAVLANSRLAGQAQTTTVLAIAINPPLGSVISNIVDPRLKSVINGRLTLTTLVPVTTADVNAATLVYFTPYVGNQIGLYTGSNWTSVAFTQYSLAVPATMSQMYDLFVDYNDGTPLLAATAWTNDTTRATALTLQDGVLVKTGDTQQRYVGSFRTTGVAGQTEDSLVKRYLWNYYNRVPRPMRAVEAADTYNYTLAAYRQVNANAANQLDFVIGVAEEMVSASVIHQASSDGGGRNIVTSIGYDSVTTPATTVIGMLFMSQGANVKMQLKAELEMFPAVGRHVLVWLEYSEAAGATAWYGDSGTPTLSQSGISGWIRG